MFRQQVHLALLQLLFAVAGACKTSTSLTTSLILHAVPARSGRDPKWKRLSSHLFKAVMVVLEEDKCAQVCGFNDRECRRMPVCKFRPAYEAAITAQSLTSSILQAMNERHTSDGSIWLSQASRKAQAWPSENCRELAYLSVSRRRQKLHSRFACFCLHLFRRFA